ncbi:DEAD/DEAH box helicase [Sphingomonas ginkgonis]|uniref:Transcription-repair-coupling factor n=1 Tax=Sphingomonas ginkgonis TaxID=2315330 RepID=A0A3S0EL10_9SPHN|nr:DEAD/DEAH box helicase [Sphingomonas ginkgonis]RST30055.1 DEAD/DEAH box helicase [Sphingomonas ginkgonis]
MSLALADGLLAIASRAADGPLLYIAATEQRAERLARLARAALPDRTILYCPATDAIPGEASPPSPANAGERVAALHALAAEAGGSAILIASAEASVYRYAPPSAFVANPPEVVSGEKVDLEALQQELLGIGYRTDERIDEPGEVGAPGTVLDVFPVDAEWPVRIEVEEGVIRSLRSYDPVSQRSHEERERLSLGRAAEPELGDQGVSLLAHHPEATVLMEPDAAGRRQRTVDLIASLEGRKRRLDPARYVDAATWQKELDGRSVEAPAEHPAAPRFITERRPARAVARFLEEQAAAKSPVLVAGSERDTRYLARRFARDAKQEGPLHRDLAQALAGDEPLAFVTVPLDAGIVADDRAILAAADLMGGRADRDDQLSASIGADLLSIELRVGDAVVHEDHGVAILKGLKPLDGPAGSGETIELEYAKDGIRQVPLGDAGKLWRYGGEPDAVRLDTLDGKSWAKRRPAIDASIAETARAIRALAREKAKADAPVLEAPFAELERFAQGFPYQETADQWKAIEAVRADLLSGKPMDRLIVGDVGFGKTEVALRAAAQAMLAGQQVALIAPTTLLARQHFELFSRRFKPLGIAVAMLSRLAAGEAKKTKAALADGSLRMVVGTSALASESVRYKDLALVIIDEEQRFGGAQKDKLARMGAGHVLRLSATPIPRTLQTALVGLNDLSIIATPPARRVPVRTTLGEIDEPTIRAALLREHGRAGQSFVVVPRIEDVPATEALLAKLVPDLTVITVHGKMKGEEAEAALVSFADGEGDVLLATSIIETGLDVPRANTMIVLDAQRFGIGQLHQLRGRVGRSSRRAAVLLMTPAGKPLPDRTRTRLMHLTAQDSLGAGFAVSAHDLDMRGAGDLVSDEQSGHMKLVGIELYQHLLTNVLKELAGEPAPPPLPAIEGGEGGHLPADWIVEPDARIAAYIRLARATSGDDLDQLADELEDRYGAVPPAAAQLLDDRRLALGARALGLKRVQIGPSGIALTPASGTKLPKDAPVEVKGDRWLLKFPPVTDAEARAKAAALLDELA